MISDERREELRALADAATPGPWRVATEVDGVRAGRRTVVKAVPAIRRVVTVDQTRPHWDAAAEANVEFIAAARSAVPELLDEVDRLTRELAATAAVRVAAQDVDDRHQNGVGGALWWAALDRLTFALTDVPDDNAPAHSHDGVRLDKVIHPRGQV